MGETSRSDTGSWRELAVARSLDPARLRAERRVQRFLDAAMELLSSNPGNELTVQEVVARSGQSLRSFYQYFAGKHELLLALLEEAVRTTAEELRAAGEGEPDTFARLHRFVVDYYEVCRPGEASAWSSAASIQAMGEFAQQLFTEHPREAARAFVPLVQLFDDLLDDAVAAGVIRAEISRDRLAGVVLQAIMFNTFTAIISGIPWGSGSADADGLWDLLIHGIGTTP